MSVRARGVIPGAPLAVADLRHPLPQPGAQPERAVADDIHRAARFIEQSIRATRDRAYMPPKPVMDRLFAVLDEMNAIAVTMDAEADRLNGKSAES